MTVETRHADVAVSIEALLHQWARSERAPAGSGFVVKAEIAARRRGGVEWPTTNSLAVGVVVRPTDLDPRSEDLVWLAANLAAVRALDRLTGAQHSSIWPDEILLPRNEGGLTVATTAATQLGPGRVEYGLMTVRIADPSALGADDEIAAAVIDELRGAAPLLDDPAALITIYRDRCATIGSQVKAKLLPSGTSQGTAETVTDVGALVIVTSTGLRETLAIASTRSVTRL